MVGSRDEAVARRAQVEDGQQGCRRPEEVSIAPTPPEGRDFLLYRVAGRVFVGKSAQHALYRHIEQGRDLRSSQSGKWWTAI